MARRKDISVTIKDEEEFLKYYDENYPKLVVLDLHPEWSGACDLMQPTFKQLQTQIDDFEKRIDIISVNFSKNLCKFQMDVEKLKNYKNEKLSCQLYLFINLQVVLANQNSYQFMQNYFAYLIKKFLSQKGKIITEVDGANVPLLQDKIQKNIPY